MGSRTIRAWWVVIAGAVLGVLPSWRGAAGASGGDGGGGGGGGCWTLTDGFGPDVVAMPSWVRPLRGAAVLLDAERMRAELSAAPMERGAFVRGGGRAIELPMPDGRFESFEVVESPVMAPELQARYPSMRTYLGQGLESPSSSVRLDLTPRGLSAQILTPEGTIRIDPFVRNNSRYHTSYYARDDRPERAGWVCEAHEGPGLAMDDLPGTRAGTPRVGGTRSTYRLAVATTGEYTALQGGATQAMNSIVTLVNDLNGVYEIEANVRFVLVANDNLVVYTDALTDPYDNSNINAMLAQNQGAIDAQIGSANYDIGHVFGTANGGIAAIGVVCTAGLKAEGVSASPLPVTDHYTVQTFCHEVGHQFNARHTFNGVNGSCTTAQRAASDAYEPGSGSTLMSYANFCSTDNVMTSYGDLYLNAQSFNRISAWVAGAGSCATTEATGNTPPDVDGGPDYSIPAFTPFVLTATGSDVDSDAVTYCWEERDLGPAQALAAGDTGAGPIVRSRAGTIDPSRSIPRLADLLAGSSSAGEIVAATSRTLNFRVTARDNHAGAGGISTDDVALSVVGTAGPFRVTSPNTNVSWMPGTQTVVWDVAGTNLVPIGCATVRIVYSVDGGATFPVTLGTGMPNTGSADVVIPEGPTTQGRIRVEAEGNIFFDVSDVNFTVPCVAPVGVVASETFCDRVDVSWAPVVGATGYSVWRGTTSAPGSAALLGPAVGASYMDSTGTLGTTYYYFVSTVAATCTSGLSLPDAGMRLPLEALGAVTASTGLCGSVELSWAAYGGATAYQVRRNTSNSLVGATIVGTPSTNSFSDTGAVPGQVYFYFVRAQTASCGFSPYATAVQGERMGTLPAPTGVAASDLVGCVSVQVTWSAVSGATGYKVWRNTVNDFGTATLLGSSGGTSFVDSTAVAGTPYYYFVASTNVCGWGGVGTPDVGVRTQVALVQTPPADADVCPGDDAVFTIVAGGSGPLVYKWTVDNQYVGTNSASFTLASVTLADEGRVIGCQISNACGEATAYATLHVHVCGPDLFVDASAGAGGNGASWGTAFQGLQEALAYAAIEASVTTVKVAAGTYRPDVSDRDVSFSPRAGVTVLGGYPAGGGLDAERDAGANVVVLSGDLAGDDGTGFANRSENSRHVVRLQGMGVVLDGVTIRGGNADVAVGAEAGGGVFVESGGEVTLRECVIADNEAMARGGGIEAIGAVTLERSSVVGNAAAQGGGVSLLGVAQLLNSTISGNVASSVGVDAGGGGVLVEAGADADVRQCTIAFNTAAGEGGGFLRAGGLLSVASSILADNAAPAGPDVWGDSGSAGTNLVKDASGSVALLGTDLVGVDPRLVALAFNGGPTPTHALGLYSRAIDAAGAVCEFAVDQRGSARPTAGVSGGSALCDIGSFEAATQAPPCAADLDDGSASNYPDGGVDINDLVFFLSQFEAGAATVDLDDGTGTGTHDGGVDVNDLLYFLSHFEVGC